MDVQSIYAARSLPRPSLSEDVLSIIAKLKISFKAPFRRPFVNKRRNGNVEVTNWREQALVDVVRKVREKDDPDYDEINAKINKLTKQTYSKLMTDILEILAKRDEMFRLRVTTLLFDRGIRQNFYATIMADGYKDIAKVYPDALHDLLSQMTMFDTLYDASKVITVPSSSDPGYDNAILEWTKQKDTKRAFAVYVSELYTRGLVPEEIMAGFVKTIVDDLTQSIRRPKTDANEENVDSFVRFIFAVVSKVPSLKDSVRVILKIPKTETPSLNFKSRFKLEDSLK
jgi:hypothetical protein